MWHVKFCQTISNLHQCLSGLITALMNPLPSVYPAYGHTTVHRSKWRLLKDDRGHIKGHNSPVLRMEPRPKGDGVGSSTLSTIEKVSGWGKKSAGQTHIWTQCWQLNRVHWPTEMVSKAYVATRVPVCSPAGTGSGGYFDSCLDIRIDNAKKPRNVCINSALDGRRALRSKASIVHPDKKGVGYKSNPLSL